MRARKQFQGLHLIALAASNESIEEDPAL